MPEGILSAVEARLMEMSGERVRLTVLDPISRERYMRFPGMLSGITASALSVECWQTVPVFPPGTPVTMEVVTNGQILRIQSAVQSCEPDRWSWLQLDMPANLETVEYRRHARVEVKSPIHLITEGEGHAVYGFLRDLSAGGAALRTEEPLSPGVRVQASLSLSTGLILERLDAEVVRCSETGDGFYVLAVQFDYSPEKQALLESYVKGRLETA
ncbi:MAG: PilZ domain-containing protein [Bacillota bacterium]